MEKLYFVLLIYINPMEKEFFELYNGLLRADLTCTEKYSLIGRPIGETELVAQK